MPPSVAQFHFSRLLASPPFALLKDMKSPLGTHPTLKPVTLEEGLKAFQCPETNGLWIPAENYWQWQRKFPTATDHGTHESHAASVNEFDDIAKLCPETGTIMTRFKVGHGMDFRIDRSICGGIWLDPGEWQALISGNLHHELNLVFTTQWQKAIRQESQAKVQETILREKLGDDLFEKLSSLRTELSASSGRSAAIAYLQS